MEFGGASSPMRPRWQSNTAASSSNGNGDGNSNDFLQLLRVDFSPLEKRFEEVFARLDALERMAVASVHATDPTTSIQDHRDQDIASSSEQAELSSSPTCVVSNGTTRAAMDAGELAKELESLHANQLRLKIQHELAQSSNKVEMESLRRELLSLPQHADLHNFRAEIGVSISSTLKSVGDQQSLLFHEVERALAMRELNENQWKALFEESMNTRIQDIWSGLTASQAKVNESVRALEAEMVSVDASTRETGENVQVMTRRLVELEKRLAIQEEEGVSQDHALAQLHALLRQSNTAMETQDAVLQSEIDTLKTLFNSTEERHSIERQAYQAFTVDTEKTLRFCTNEITTNIHSGLQAHHEKLMALDTGLTRFGGELKLTQDHLQKHESRLSSLDGRLVQQEKATATLTHVLQDQHHEMTHHVSEIHKGLELALQDRVAIKRSATELGFTVQEVQQTLQEVGKMAATTELSLTRTAAEIPKLHVLVHTNLANITKNRQSISDLSLILIEEKKVAQQLAQQFDKEVQASVVRFLDLHKRDEAARQSITQTNTSMQQMKHALEESIKYNSNMIHQLNTMVDSLAITESATDMDDKLARFALQTAELGVKLEHFSTPGGTNPGQITKDDVKADLAVLLTKIIRFLGSGVAIDQNKYFLSASKLAMPTNDPHSGALVFELPASHLLEQMRASKVTLFVTKMRTFMDQLRPVAQNVTHIHDYRDHFTKKVQYVLEFGLSNLFPNMGRPRHPNKRLGNVGTCIACDRPLEEDEEHEHSYGGGGGGGGVEVLGDPEVEAVEEQRMRRSKIVASAGVTHRIDTRTPVKGRSGAPPLSSGGMGGVFHHAPGTNEYVYRAGFRLPRPATAGGSGLPKSVSAVELAVGHSVGGPPCGGDTKQTLDDSVSSCLEKVALVGKHSSNNSLTTVVEVPKPVPSTPSPLLSTTTSPPLVRPHTAPLRSRSLPRLEVVIEPTASR